MISVCIATYNGEKYIKAQLESILEQLSYEDEVIISDDCSNDSTISIITAFNDPRIKIYKNHFRNVVKNFEFCIMMAAGDIIFLSDQDDIWKANKVFEFRKSFEEGYDLVISDCEIMESSSGKIIEPSFYKFNNSGMGIVKNLISNSYIGCCMAFKSEIKNKVLPFPTNIPMHDSWIGLMAEIHGKVKFEPQKLIKYRLHSANSSYTGTGKSRYGLLKKINFRMVLIKNLLTRL